MPRRRLSESLLTLHGARRKDPQRYRERSIPVPTSALGEAPATFTAAERAAWAMLAACAPDRVLFKRDEPVLALAARLWASIASRPMAQVRSAEVARMESLLARLGMTPSDANRVSVGATPEPNEFDEFAIQPWKGRRPGSH
jgi:hypothetical protein